MHDLKALPKSLFAAMPLVLLLVVLLLVVLLLGMPLPTRAEKPVAVSGSYALTQAMENDQLALYQIAAGRSLTPADRQTLQRLDISVFRHDPTTLIQNARQSHRILPVLRTDIVRQAAERKRVLVNVYIEPEVFALTDAEAAQMQAVFRRYVPVVFADPQTDFLITGSDIDAWQAAASALAAETKIPATLTRAQMVQIARTPKLPYDERKNIAGMEEGWLALQRRQRAQTATDRARVAAQMTQIIQRRLRGDIPVATSGAYTLTQSDVDDDLALWQITANDYALNSYSYLLISWEDVTDKYTAKHPLSPADRQAIQQIDIAVFRRSPAWFLAGIRTARTALPRVRQRFYFQFEVKTHNLTGIYCMPQILHMTQSEAAQMQAVMRRYVSVVSVDRADSVVLTKWDIDIFFALSHLAASKNKASRPITAAERATLIKSAQNPKTARSIEELDNSGLSILNDGLESNYEIADQRRQTDHITPMIREFSGQGQASYVAGAALALSAEASSDNSHP